MMNRPITVADALQTLRPGAPWVLRDDELEWLDTRQEIPTLEEITAEIERLRKERVWDKIKAERDRRQFNGIKVAGYWFHTDIDSRIKWMALERQAERVMATPEGTPDTVLVRLGQPVVWKVLGSEAYVPVTVQLALDINEAVGNLDATLHHVGNQHKATMMAAADSEAYDFSTGWPTTFGDPEPAPASPLP